MNADALTALCDAAMPEEHLTRDELSYLCFGERDEIFGDDDGAAVLHTTSFGGYVAAWLILVAVAPGAQEKGRGKDLVRAVIERARALGAQDLLLASAI